MKVTFVYPRVPYYYARTPYLPLGIAYLAASVKGLADSISCIDGQALAAGRYEIELSRVKSEVVCISATLLQMKEACRVADLIKKNSPSTRVLIGGYGPHSVPPEQLFSMGQFDVFVRGEGEVTLSKLLRAYIAGENIGEIPDIVFRQQDRVITSPTGGGLPNMGELPRPMREIFDVEWYLRTWKKNTGMSSLHLITSRGCPFSCAFCDKSVTGRTYRFSKPGAVVDEMEQLRSRYRPDDLFLFDDLFTLRRNRVLEVCREVQRRKLIVNWSAQGRVGLNDVALISAMKSAGCSELFFGVESGSDRILSILGKGFTRQEVIRTFQACHEAGMRAGVYIIVGVPGETKHDIDQTIDLIKKIRPSLVNFSFLTPFPNTRIYQETLQWIDQPDWTKWDDFTTTVYKGCFEVDPAVSRRRIMKVYRRMISEGLDYSAYQKLE